MVYPHVQYQGPAYPDRLQANTPRTTRELDSRTNDGIHVQLLWIPRDGHASVVVTDSKTGETLELPVRDGDRALDVFHHPYAYAARRPDRIVRPARTSAPTTSAA